MGVLKKSSYFTALGLSLLTGGSNLSRTNPKNNSLEGLTSTSLVQTSQTGAKTYGSLSVETQYSGLSFEDVTSRLIRYNEAISEVMEGISSFSLSDIDRAKRLEGEKESQREKKRQEMPNFNRNSRKESSNSPKGRPILSPSFVINPLEMIVGTIFNDKRTKTINDHYVDGSLEQGRPVITLKKELDTPRLKVLFSYNQDCIQNRMVMDIEDKKTSRHTITFITAYNPDSGKFEDRYPSVNLWSFGKYPGELATLTGDFSANHPLKYDVPQYVALDEGANRDGDLLLRKSEEKAENNWRNITRALYDHFNLPKWENSPPLVQSGFLMDERDFASVLEEMLRKNQPLIFNQLCLKDVDMKKTHIADFMGPQRGLVAFYDCNLSNTLWNDMGNLGQVDFRSSTLKGSSAKNTFIEALFDEGEEIKGLDKD